MPGDLTAADGGRGLVQWVLSGALDKAHGRRKLVEAEEDEPDAVKQVLESIGGGGWEWFIILVHRF